MPVPPNPHFDLIKLLLGEGGHRLNARPSAGMREYVNRRDFDLGTIPESGRNVIPGPGSNRPPSKDEWFDRITPEDLMEDLGNPKRTFNELQPDERPGSSSDTAMFNELMGQAESAGKKSPSGSPPGGYFVWVTNKSGKRIRLSGPFDDAREAQKEMDRLAKASPKVSLSIGTVDPE